MEEKITIAGIELENCSAQESVRILEEELGKQTFILIEEITMHMLLLAQGDDGLREALGNVTHTIIGEAGVLEAAGVENPQRKREIERHEFFYGLMESLEHSGRSLFLLGQGVEETDRFFQYLQNEFSGCNVIGVAAMEENVGADAVVNEINAAAADAILCMIPSPERASFLLQYKDKISASLWYGMEPDKILPREHRVLRWLRRLLHRRKLAEHVEKLGKQMEESVERQLTQAEKHGMSEEESTEKQEMPVEESVKKRKTTVEEPEERREESVEEVRG